MQCRFCLTEKNESDYFPSYLRKGFYKCRLCANKYKQCRKKKQTKVDILATKLRQHFRQHYGLNEFAKTINGELVLNILEKNQLAPQEVSDLVPKQQNDGTFSIEISTSHNE